ncbi:hypothetical protein [Sulfurovum riftiae]|uniref:hypothetical protein n=1 Tax=Sulfurovum riftiae TaxID=1630136 RepID=UPI00137B711A|nr:hypothetical protein [Sulfurovum riftiae]
MQLMQAIKRSSTYKSYTLKEKWLAKNDTYKKEEYFGTIKKGFVHPIKRISAGHSKKG